MKVLFCKHKMFDNDLWWFELGISWQTTRVWHGNKHIIIIALFFWSIYIQYGGNK